MKSMTDELHQMGIRTTLWVANFVNVDSNTFAEHRNDGFLVRDISGNVGITGWWAGFGSVWDYTNPAPPPSSAADLCVSNNVTASMGSSSIPARPTSCRATCAPLCPSRPRNTPTISTGLAAMISQAFTVSLRGFFYVMPDIVGGNEYGREPLDKELLVRWAQASALMPLIQFSKGP